MFIDVATLPADPLVGTRRRRFVRRRVRGHRPRRRALRHQGAPPRYAERRLLSWIAQYGEPFEPAETPAAPAATKVPQAPKPANDPTPPSPGGVVEPKLPSEKTFADVAAEYQSTFMITDLKPTSRRGYTSVLECTLLPRFGEDPISKVDGAAASALDVEMSKRQRARATRNNIQIVLRSVLQFAVKRKYLADVPANLPRLKPVEQTLLEIPSDDQVKKLLETANELHRRAFAAVRAPPQAGPRRGCSSAGEPQDRVVVTDW